ncbi:general substrate transporter [Meredithblackwellia eburnea MCA 4105]
MDSSSGIELEKAGVALHGTTDVERTEAPVSFKAYLACAWAGWGGILFGYDSGYINGVTGAKVFVEAIEGVGKTALTASHNSLITSILSAGTFFGCLMAGDLADYFGRRPTIIAGCLVYMVGVAIQTAAEGSHALALLVAGRFIAGIGAGYVSAIVILYMGEIAPKRFRGMIISAYQFCLTFGIMLAAVVNNFTSSRGDNWSYRIPIVVQFCWGLILGGGLLVLPDSPRFFVKKGKIDEAIQALARVRGQDPSSDYIQLEIAEIVANNEYERKMIPQTSYFGSWVACFTGSWFKANSNIRRTFLGTSAQACQQFTGINFVFYFSTPFLKSTGAIKNPFIMSLIFTLVNVFSTPISFWTVERFGRRPLLIWGAVGMIVSEFIVGAIGVTIGFNKTHLNAAGASIANNIPAVNAQIAFICFYIFSFASTWGPVVVGEAFPLPIRSRGVALSVASNWFWNTVRSIFLFTPYLVDQDEGYLRSSVFFLWGGMCFICLAYAYFLVPETKNLTLEQVDRMLEEVVPRKSAGWKPSTTFAAEMAHKEVRLDSEKASV